MGLKKALILSVTDLTIHCDSQFVANQLTREYAARNQIMESYMKLAQKLIRNFRSAYIERFPKMSKSHADALATLASAVDSDMKRIIDVEFLPRPSIETEQTCHLVFDIEANLGPSWMDPIISYLRDGTLPNDSNEAYRIRAQATRY